MIDKELALLIAGSNVGFFHISQIASSHSLKQIEISNGYRVSE